MLPVCTSSQKVYGVLSNTNGTPFSSGLGDSPGEACLSFARGQAGTITAASDNLCTITTNAMSFAIAKQCDNSPQLTPDKIADMSLLWGLFLVVAIVIYGLRRLLNIFESAPHGE
jgi:hypothetical protein